MKQVHDGRIGLARRPVSELLGNAAEHAQEVVKAEAQLAVAQVKEEVQEAMSKAVVSAAGFLLATVALVLLLVAAVLYLATLMAAWAATLIVGAVVAVGAVIMFAVTRAR